MPSTSKVPAAAAAYLEDMPPYAIGMRGGKIVSAFLDIGENVVDRAMALPVFGALEKVAFWRASRVTARMNKLRVAHGVYGRGLKLLAEKGHPKLETLGIANTWTFDRTSMVGGVPKAPFMRALAATESLPALRQLSLRLGANDWRAKKPRGPRDYAWLWKTSFGPKLRWLDVTASEGTFSDWLAAAPDLPVATLVLSSFDRCVVIDRKAKAITFCIATDLDDARYIGGFANRALRRLGKNAASFALALEVMPPRSQPIMIVGRWPKIAPRTLAAPLNKALRGVVDKSIVVR